MKEWQKGYDLNYLVNIEKKYYEKYNQFALSPFGKIKKNTIASYLADNTLYSIRSFEDGDIFGYYRIQICKTSSNIVMYQDVVIGQKQKGDIVISCLGIDPSKFEEFYKNFVDVIRSFDEQGKFVWFYILEEDNLQKEILNRLPFIKKAGVKIDTFSSIYGIYYLSLEDIFGNKREYNELHPYEKIDICPLQLPKFDVSSIQSKLTELDFENHYSKYNKSKSWSAVSLRGYSPDPLFITKPSEMNDKWNEEHKNEKFEIQNTGLLSKFPEVCDILLKNFNHPLSSRLNWEKIHRIRFMKLIPGGGELQRHTDQTDCDSGISNGKLMRIHIPIVTNPKVIFTMWDYEGKKHEYHFKQGEVFYLDTRKPHMAVNGGDTERIHLVLDLESSDYLRHLLDVSKVN